MKIKKIMITGDPEFTYRHRYLWEALSPSFEKLEVFSREDSLNIKANALIHKLAGVVSTGKVHKGFHKSSLAFKLKSQEVEQTIKQLKDTPDLVFHLYCMWSPFWEKSEIPYTIFSDYTMSLAIKNWKDWVPFSNQTEKDTWLAFEKQAYQRAYHLFPMSNMVKSSLIEDYGIDPKKITVIGSSGNFKEPSKEEKVFGSKRILFNGSDFERKGGDLVLSAFKKVRQAIPEAKLIVVGKKLEKIENGIENYGSVSNLDIHKLLLKTDVLVAPARCEPFGLLLVEAMNCGVPCIVSKTGGMPEIVNHQSDGIVINQPNPELLAKEIIRLLSNHNLLQSMSTQARQTIKDKFNWESIAKNIVQTLYA
ncbi:MAG: glycosyltransferase family 4 protein [Rhizonema sp. PD37]|nr:glycosyltransferase family 4 protein [Rhizonema sp. PD37]